MNRNKRRGSFTMIYTRSHLYIRAPTGSCFFYNGFFLLVLLVRRSVNSRLMIINGYRTEESVRGSEKEWRAAIKRRCCNQPSTYTHTPFTALSFAKVARLRSHGCACSGESSSSRRTKILRFLEWEKEARLLSLTSTCFLTHAQSWDNESCTLTKRTANMLLNFKALCNYCCMFFK